MNKTINVNIGGLFFHMDETAYQYLKGYLDAIAHSLRENKESQKEILDDIESRISELLTERIIDKRQVVNKNDIDEIIKIMGKPEDYLVDEELFTNNEIPPRKTNFKKLFRDLDNKYLGGVCSGLGNYVSVSAVWVRIIFVILFGLGVISSNLIGSFIFFLFTYILLLIIIPPARTTTEKLQMTGKPVTITNIEEKRKEETYYKSNSNLSESEANVEQNITSPPPTHPKKSFFTNLGDGIVALFTFIFTFIGKLIGLALVIGTSIAFIAIFIGLFSWGSFEILDVSDEFMRIPDEIYGSILPSWLILTSIFILTSVILFGLLLLGIKIISHKATLFNRPTWMTLLALWLISLFIIIFWGIDITSKEKYSQIYFETNELPYLEKDTIFINMQPYRNQIERNKATSINTLIDEISVSKDNKVRLIIKKIAKGKTNNDALECAKNMMKYKYDVSDNILLLDNHFDIDKKNKFRAIAVFLNLEVPKNMVINFGKYMSNGIVKYDS